MTSGLEMGVVTIPVEREGTDKKENR